MSIRQHRLDRIEALSVLIWTTPALPDVRRLQRLVLHLEARLRREDREHRT